MISSRRGLSIQYDYEVDLVPRIMRANKEFIPPNLIQYTYLMAKANPIDDRF